MTRKTIFVNKKYILSSGRELDLTAEHIGEKVIILAMFNILDPVQEIGHAALMRIESNHIVSFESLGTNSNNTSDENLKELSKPIEGINGADSTLKIFELNELISVMQQFLQKIEKELVTTTS